MELITSDIFYEQDNRVEPKIDSRKLLAAAAKDTLTMDKLELQQLIKEKSDRITFKENPHGSSQVWDTYRMIVVDGVMLEFVCCKRCLVVYKYTSSGGTTGLNRHRVLCMANSGNELNLLESDDCDEDDILDASIEQLISSVKIRPELYDGTDESVRTENLWSLIASEVGKEIEWCRKSWQSLLVKFLRRFNMLKNNNSDGMADSSWVYMDYLDFLGEHIRHIENKVPALPIPTSGSKRKRKYRKHPKLERPDFQEMEIQLPGSDNFNFMNEGDFEDGSDEPQYGNNSYRPRTKQKKYSNDFNDKDLWTINLQHQDSRKLDAHDLFCMSLAVQMRSLPSIYASKSRLKISEIMHSMEMEADRS